ncbi:hypothetical protein XA68_12286 [Ophiocordyceps unilateralis]|uniref:Heterokaryon incompatibility domain-containing protein n=1 Tax=Ophiocordyceps unilateralis TaxID=268505 RepID=A0A2A9PE15_OPHUN|nr:hypothetical protein XA68_12286 [Ophiocordyceps unilateralis]
MINFVDDPSPGSPLLTPFANMTETSTDTGLAVPDRAGIPRRRSKNPLRTMMQHLTVELPSDEGGEERGSLMRRLSWRSKSRSPSAHSDASSSRAASSDPTLCAACAVLAADMELTLTDLDRAYREARNDDPRDSAESLVGRLRGLDAASTCPLCRMFAAVRISAGDGVDCCLSAFSSRDASPMVDASALFDAARDPGPAPTFLAVVPANKSGVRVDVPDCFRRAGMLLRTRPPDRAPRTPAGADHHPGSRPRTPVSPGMSSAAHQAVWGRELGTAADMTVARDWLDFCRCHHPTRCRSGPSGSAELAGFRLVDCMETPPRVVPASLLEHQYAALSYVGEGAAAAAAAAAAEVVRDAAVVTRQLGLRYLWVRGPCLDGASAEERASHVARMDDVLGGAVLAIIAAVDAGRGLPGVGSTDRLIQPKHRFVGTDLTLVSSLADPRLVIERSAWYRRASTYQDGLLARRRLVFTEQQMYWECEGMLCPEALDLPLRLWHDARQQRMCDFVRPGLFNNSDAPGWRAWRRLPDPAEEPSPMSVFRAGDRHVVAYTRRRLCRDEDSLSGFLGLARHLERTLGRGRLGHLVGIPVWRPGRTKDLFALSTSFWHHAKDDEDDVDYGHGGDEVVEPKRLPHLPSWTWAGWEGAVDLFSSIAVPKSSTMTSPGGLNERRLLSQHYVTASQLVRDEPPPAWTYSPDLTILHASGDGIAYDFQQTIATTPSTPGRYLLHVSDPLVLDRVKARCEPGGGWIFNDVSVDVRLSRGGSGGLREYVERHGRGEQMTVLWFVEEATVMLLVLQRVDGGHGRWERVGRARMAFATEPREVVRRFGRLEVMLNHLPLRRLGEDIVIE